MKHVVQTFRLLKTRFTEHYCRTEFEFNQCILFYMIIILSKDTKYMTLELSGRHVTLSQLVSLSLHFVIGMKTLLTRGYTQHTLHLLY